MSRQLSEVSRWVLPLLIACGSIGCVGWRSDPSALTQQIPARQRVEIWTATGRHDVHGVRLHGDSVRAVPYWQPPDCDSCALYFRRAAIDSIRTQSAVNVRSEGTLGAVFVMLLALWWLAFRVAG